MGVSAAAPAPWTARAATSGAGPGARAQASDAIPNTASPVANRRRWPSRSPARPATISRPPNASVYALRTHCRPDAENPSDRWISGRAIATIVTSSTTRNWAAHSMGSVTFEVFIAGNRQS